MLADYAISECYEIQNIYFKSKDTVIENYAIDSSYWSNITIYGYNPSTAKSYADKNGIAFSEFPELSKFTYTVDENDSAVITGFTGTNSAVEIPCSLGGHAVVAIGGGAFSGKTNLKSLTIHDGIKNIGRGAFDNCPNLKIYGYGSCIEKYVADYNIPFCLMAKTNIGGVYNYSPLTAVQSKAIDDTSFDLTQNSYKNIELLGVQKKIDKGTNDMRFVAVINEGLIKDADEDGNIVDYGFVAAKTDYTSTAGAKESFIKKVTLNASKTLSRSCLGTDNGYSGIYGKSDTNTKYKYITFVVKDVPANQGFVVRFYIKTKSGKVYYANYNKDYTGCVTSYAGLSAALV